MLRIVRVILHGLIVVGLSSESFQLSSKDSPNIRKVENVTSILGFTGDLSLPTTGSHIRSRVMCMFDRWSIDRQGQEKFSVEDIDPTLCTHLIIRLFEIKNVESSGNFVLDDEKTTSINDDLYEKVRQLKKQNQKLKILVSVGGWDEGTKDFQSISSNFQNRNNFVTNAFKFLKERRFDGLNVEWMWPGDLTRGGSSEDKDGLTDLMSSLSQILKPQKMELVLTVAPETGILETGFNFAALQGSVDYFIVALQDLAGAWGEVTGHHSPLEGQSYSTAASIARFILGKKVSPGKIILGIPFAGRASLLNNTNDSDSGLGAPIVQGQGIMGRDGLFLGYDQICYRLNRERSNWTVYEDDEAKVPFMKDTKGNWVSFETPKSVRTKVEFGKTLGLGGYAAWPITSDDFKGNLCGGSRDQKAVNFPLLRTINAALSSAGNMLTPLFPGILFYSVAMFMSISVA